jgi:putative phage-type endonuclease
MTALPVRADTEAEWLAARREGVTASEIAVVMGLSPHESPFALYHRKRGGLAVADNDAMRIGRHLESLVCEMFTERYPGLLALGNGRGLFAHPDRPWQMATPDRLLHEHGGPYSGGPSGLDSLLAVLEAKTAASYDGWGEDGSDEIPVHYRCQLLWQMDVMGVDAGYVACLFLHSRQLRVYEVALDETAAADLKLMREEAALFLDRHLRAGIEPDVDWRPATAEMLKRLHPDLEDRDVTIAEDLAGRYRAACSGVKDAEKLKAQAENEIRAALGSGRRALGPDGQVIATRQVYEVKAHVRSACTVNKLVPARGKS